MDFPKPKAGRLLVSMKLGNWRPIYNNLGTDDKSLL